MRLMDALIRVDDLSKRYDNDGPSGRVTRHRAQTLVVFMVLLVAAASATLGLTLLTAANWLFDRAFAPEGGQFYLIADALIAMLTLMLAAAAECSTIPMDSAASRRSAGPPPCSGLNRARVTAG